MTGIIFPDLGNALAIGANMKNQNTLRRQREEEMAREQEAAQHVPGALSGDREALNKVASISPGTAIKLAPLLERMDTNQRTRMKEMSGWTAQAAMGVLSLPPEQRPAAYAQTLAEGKMRGYDTSSLPPQYTPDIEGRLRFHANQARDINKWFEMQDNEPKPMGPPGGTSPAQAIGGIESGGRYDAVGPVANSQGHRAYGKYQVLESNIGPWTQEILGKPMTPQEFIASPQAQDAVFKAKFGQYEKQYGPEGAARAWFAGPGGMNNPNAKDVLGTTVLGYGQKFTQATGGAPPGIAQGDNTGRGNGSGNPVPSSDPAAQVRGIQLPAGARVMTQKGVPMIKDGTVLIMKADGSWDAIPLPTRADPKSMQPPVGYEPNPEGGLRPISGGPADAAQVGRLTEAKRKADEKMIPASVTKGIQENLSALKQLDRVDEELKKVPDSVGGPGSVLANSVPGVGLIQSRMDPGGVKLRALIADIGSLKIHDRSGAAVTASEFPRLKPFIPQISDDAKTVGAKLANFRAVYDEVMRDTLEYYGPTNGFREYTPATKYIGGDQPKVGVSAEQGRALFEARDAISKGAARDAVVERLVKMGIDPSGL